MLCRSRLVPAGPRYFVHDLTPSLSSLCLVTMDKVSRTGKALRIDSTKRDNFERSDWLMKKVGRCAPYFRAVK